MKKNTYIIKMTANKSLLTDAITASNVFFAVAKMTCKYFHLGARFNTLKSIEVI